MITPEDVLSFWLDEIGPSGWYKAEDALDQEIRDRFEAGWSGAMEGRHALWLTYASEADGPTSSCWTTRSCRPQHVPWLGQGVFV